MAAYNLFKVNADSTCVITDSGMDMLHKYERRTYGDTLEEFRIENMTEIQKGMSKEAKKMLTIAWDYYCRNTRVVVEWVLSAVMKDVHGNPRVSLQVELLTMTLTGAPAPARNCR